jgi:hypothetical protein
MVYISSVPDPDLMVGTNVADPNSLNPDPAFLVNPDPDTNPGLG